MGIQLDLGYFRRVEGIVRLVEVVLGIIVLICTGCVGWYTGIAGKGFIEFTAASSLISSLIVLILYFLHVTELPGIARIPWLMIEVVFCCIWALFYFISGCIAAAYSGRYPHISNLGPPFGAASFFCFVAMVVYGFNVFLFVKMVRSERYATSTTTTAESGGGVTVQRTITTTTVEGRY